MPFGTLRIARTLAATNKPKQVTALELIIDLHKNSARQGPGSENDTLQALNLLYLTSDQNLKVADIGCGSGGQTISLAKNINGQVSAVDLFPKFFAAEMKGLGFVIHQ